MLGHILNYKCTENLHDAMPETLVVFIEDLLTNEAKRRSLLKIAVLFLRLLQLMDCLFKIVHLSFFVHNTNKEYLFIY